MLQSEGTLTYPSVIGSRRRLSHDEPNVALKSVILECILGSAGSLQVLVGRERDTKLAGASQRIAVGGVLQSYAKRVVGWQFPAGVEVGLGNIPAGKLVERGEKFGICAWITEECCHA